MKMNSIKPRFFLEKDYPAILVVWKECNLGDEKRGDNLATIENSLLHGGKFWVLENTKNKNIIACCWVSNDFRRLYMHHLGVLPEYQHKGYGKLLTETALAYAKSMNMQIKLEVHHSNKRAIDLYKKFGLKFIEGYEVMIKRK
jgi:ribosomal protein S18 acetylase RimI-like enzyme